MKRTVNKMVGVIMIYLVLMIAQYCCNVMLGANVETYWPFGFVINTVFALPTSILCVLQ